MFFLKSYASNNLAQFLQNLAWTGQNFWFSICQSRGKCFDPWEWVEKACLQGGARLNFPGAGQIYQLHRPRKAATTKRKQKDIGKYRGGEILCLKGGRGTTLRGRMRRSKQSGQSKKRNNKKLLENTPSSHPLLQEKYTGLETARLWKPFFLSFSLRLSENNRSRVKFMAKFGPTASNFGYIIFPIFG